MSELAPLIEDLAFILVLAGIVTIFCKKFNQPLVLGYILAGFFASPHFNLLPNVVDTANITVWSDIGVIFILFSLGLDFNFAKIKSIGGTALIAAVTELTGITLLGYACARLLGWQPIDSLFAGAMLTMSSTAVVSKTFEELGLLKERFTQFTFGILVLEDISGIIMMVMLSTIIMIPQPSPRQALPFPVQKCSAVSASWPFFSLSALSAVFSSCLPSSAKSAAT